MADRAAVEYLCLQVDGYTARATDAPNGAVEVRASNALDNWWILTITGALGNQPDVKWSPSWLPGEAGADLRHDIERRVIRAVRVYHGRECSG